MRHLLSLFDLSREEYHQILSIAAQLKKLLYEGRRPNLLPRQITSLLFEKPSLRTRVSFEAGMTQLGGSAMFLGPEVGWQHREATSDFIRVLGQYADYIVCRAKHHSTVEELAAFNSAPVINGLTDHCHPCQALADVLTIQESTPDVIQRQVTFVGDGNNVALSLARACALSSMKFRLLGPKNYFLGQESIQEILKHCPDADIEQTEDLKVGLANADYVYTDVWTSMGQEEESERRKRDFADFQVNESLMSVAPKECKVLHCLPAKRGEEITDGVIDGPNSLTVLQAGNRMHAQKGLLIWLGLQQGKLSEATLIEAGVKL